MIPADLARLHAAAFAATRPWSEAEFTTLLAQPHTDLISAPRGFALIRVIATEAELLTIAVAPAARRRGTGRELLTTALTRAANRGAETMFLDVAADNSGAIALYLDAGFARTGTRPGYYRTRDGARIDAALFSRPL